jgi:valyl-tRNA synthetase
MDLDKQYNPRQVENKWYTLWESKGYFRPASDSSRSPFPVSRGRDERPYVIVIPPPNVTGILHMGHALNNSIQDILIRWNRMKGCDTLWVPGVDHAGIATQNVVEKKLAKEKKTRWDLGREEFLKEIWKWKEEHGSTITRQLRRLGASCDWTRERFTMDEGCSRAVREAFVTLYERGLIYRGNYIINWCPRCQTALSDEEAAHKDVQGGLYHIKYPIPGKNPPYEKMGEDHIVVATTRPETMLGDTAVAVHPNDPRYKHLIGKKVILPLMNREIPVIADEFVDPEFGTGIVKVTPAHDPNDFAMGHRHKLEQINVMTPDGKINENGGAYKGIDRFEARKKILQDLEEQGLFVRRDSHLHAVGHCYRCDTVVEPYLSKQWFVKMQPLAEKALKAHEQGKTVFYPDRWTKVYLNWLRGIRDWCISRQIWWGHQIPAWYCKQCQAAHHEPRTTHHEEQRGSWLVARGPEGIIVSRTTPEKCPHCGGTDLVQDPDVLDTWFSSWLWPFSTLGWPEKTEDLKKFYPTSDLITAPEIIFFWVARMIMAGLEFMGEVPFSRINIHGTVRAASGLKMSKSLGNSIDPLEVIEEMGADALRYSLVMLSAQDVYLSREKFEVGRNFATKVWNACRFVFMNLEATENLKYFGPTSLLSSLPDRWILSKLSAVTQIVENHLKDFELAQAASELYHFVWNDFCDWYIELTKPVFEKGTNKEKEATRAILFYTLEKILRLLHPFMPFITEELWQHLKGIVADKKGWPETLMLARWPLEELGRVDEEADRHIKRLQDAVVAIRDLRARVNLPPSQSIEAVVVSSNRKILKIFEEFLPQIKVLGRLKDLKLTDFFQKSKAYLECSLKDFEVLIRIEGILDPEEEKKRLQKKIRETEQWIEQIRKKVENPSFAEKAPKEILEKEKEKLADAKKLLVSYQTQLQSF